MLLRIAALVAVSVLARVTDASARPPEGPGLPFPAPECRFDPLGGGEGGTLAEHRGSVVYVDFWASWCRSCTDTFPFLSALTRGLGPKGLRVVAINLDEDPRDATRFLAEHPAEFLVASGADGACASAFGVAVMPTAFLVDRDGIVRWRNAGSRNATALDVRARIEALLSEGAPAR
jgi:thiol-disulfide isomerase/thioredoxin